VPAAQPTSSPGGDGDRSAPIKADRRLGRCDDHGYEDFTGCDRASSSARRQRHHSRLLLMRGTANNDEPSGYCRRTGGLASHARPWRTSASSSSRPVHLYQNRPDLGPSPQSGTYSGTATLKALAPGTSPVGFKTIIFTVNGTAVCRLCGHLSADGRRKDQLSRPLSSVGLPGDDAGFAYQRSRRCEPSRVTTCIRTEEAIPWEIFKLPRPIRRCYLYRALSDKTPACHSRSGSCDS